MFYNIKLETDLQEKDKVVLLDKIEHLTALLHTQIIKEEICPLQFKKDK